jgi:integrase
MVYRKHPSYLWPNRTGLYHLKVPIPPGLGHHFPSDTTGKPRTHIVESLGTHSRAEAERRKLGPLLQYRAEFDRLAGKARAPAPKPGQALVTQVREALRELRAGWEADRVSDDDYSELGMVYAEKTEAAFERVRREEGDAAAELARQKMLKPDVLTIREALPPFLDTKRVSEQYKGAYELAVNDLLSFLDVQDALATSVSPARALAYVDHLNAGDLTASPKKKRLSNLNQLWKYMHRRGWPVSPWGDHTITDSGSPKRKAAGRAAGDEDPDGNEEVRGFTDAEAVRVLTLPAPQDKRRRTYTRALFRELYALGFTTGMRLNEIASLRPTDVLTLPDGWLSVTLRRSVVKNDESARTIPIGHPVAVSILVRRVGDQKDQKGRLFFECAPGGPDKKPSWHVSKAMSRERIDPKRLGFGGDVNYHSTRHSFGTLLENGESLDTVGQQRYMGHSIQTTLLKTYSGGAGLRKLRAVVDGLRYSPEVEEALRKAVVQESPPQASKD